MINKITIILLFTAISNAQSQTEILIYKQSCDTGVAAAVEVLPTTPDKDGMLTRGYNSCAGSLKRLQKSGELKKEKNIVEFACGYSVGAMFAKYGLQAEIKPLSQRAQKAFDKCAKEMKVQIDNIKK